MWAISNLRLQIHVLAFTTAAIHAAVVRVQKYKWINPSSVVTTYGTSPALPTSSSTAHPSTRFTEPLMIEVSKEGEFVVKKIPAAALNELLVSLYPRAVIKHWCHSGSAMHGICTQNKLLSMSNRGIHSLTLHEFQWPQRTMVACPQQRSMPHPSSICHSLYRSNYPIHTGSPHV